MSLVRPVEVAGHPVARLERVIGGERQARLVGAADQFRQRLAGRTVWNVSSTAVGGGVAEMLRVLVGYIQDLDIPVRWRVISGDAEFFVITKRLHNQIHGEAAGGPLGGAAADHYARMLAANAVGLARRDRPGDLVLLHDPQTAGLVAALAQCGRAGSVALPYRCGLGKRRHPGGVGLSAAVPGRRGRLRLLPPRVRATVDSEREGLDHTAVDRSFLPEEPASRGRHCAGHPGQDRRAGRCPAGGADDLLAQRRHYGRRHPVCGDHR